MKASYKILYKILIRHHHFVYCLSVIICIIFYLLVSLLLLKPGDFSKSMPLTTKILDKAECNNNFKKGGGRIKIYVNIFFFFCVCGIGKDLHTPHSIINFISRQKRIV